MKTLCMHAPAKVNLFLAVTGRRSDGFHNLVSLAVPLDWGDDLELHEEGGEEGRTKLICDSPALPSDETNLVLRAAAVFRAETSFMRNVSFTLKKRVPVGAGLGGGSSDAVAALRGLNALWGYPLDEEALFRLAVSLGSDCPLFLSAAPAIMRGRGEQLDRLSDSECQRLRCRKIFLCKPAFPVSTAWAYAKISETQGYYSTDEAEMRLRAWREGDSTLEALLFNNMEPVVFAKYPALPVLAAVMHERFGLDLRMSGSGSACFALLPEEETLVPQSAYAALVHEYWGASAFARVARFV